MEKYLLTREAIEKESPDFLKYSMRFSPTARKEDVLLVHDKEYVERVLTQKLTREEARTIGFPMSEQSDGYASKFLSEDETKRGEQHVTRSLASTGGTIKMTRDVLEYGFMWAGQLAGGTHHAFAGHGEGFCVFNDIACAVRVAQRDYEELFEGEDRNVLIVDLDVHQGNGTAKIFENDKNIITYSIHGDRNYPWKTRMLSDYDIALPDDCEDEEYLNALKTSLPKVFEKHKPFLVYFQAGVDALKADSFGRLSMTREGLRRRNNLVLALCVEHDCKLVTTMGGGYAKPIERSIECHSDVFRIMALKHKAIMEERKYLEKIMKTTKIQWYYVAAFVALMICVSASVRVVHAAVNTIIPSNEVFLDSVCKCLKEDAKDGLCTSFATTSGYGTMPFWMTRDITNMANAFDLDRLVNAGPVGCNLTEIEALRFNADLKYWDTSHVTNFDFMFRKAKSFDGKGLRFWNVGNAETMRGMFQETTEFDDNIAFWDLRNVIDLSKKIFNVRSALMKILARGIGHLFAAARTL